MMVETGTFESNPLPSPWRAPWPEGSLEQVPNCPVCGGATRTVLHDQLVDNSFRVAPGRWTLHRCLQCSSAYLDPRPDRASIGAAYGQYYTHTVSERSAGKANPRGLRRLKLSLSNGYARWRYGSGRMPSSRWGIWLAPLLGRQQQRMDAEFRHLPKPLPGQKLLDVGCGNGDFLASARDAGWDIVGIDPDPKAVAAACDRGLDASVGSIESLDGASQRFDAITLSHVIEHVHDPGALIRSIHRLLKPGGTLYVDTPNIQSRGAAEWGRNWRGLEAPRHLVLFSLDGLVGLLQANGFGHLQVKRRTAVRKFIYLASLRMQQGRSPSAARPANLPLTMRLRLKYLPVSARHDEFLTLVATRDDKHAGHDSRR